MERGLFKRFLVGAGILTGAGVVGYQCYAGPEDIDRQEVNPAQPYPEGPPVDPMMPDCGSAAMLNDALAVTACAITASLMASGIVVGKFHNHQRQRKTI